MQFDFVTIIPDTLFLVSPGNPMWPSPANSYIVRDGEGFILIDCGYGDHESYLKFVKFLSKNGFDITRDLKTVIFSHAHPDHMGGAANLLSSIKCRTLISRIEAPAARNPALLEERFDIPMAKKCFDFLKVKETGSFDLLDLFDTKSCPMCSMEPDGVISEGDVIRTEKLNLEVIHTPGHSPGHVSLYDPDNKLLFSGDVVGEITPWYCPSGGGAIGCLESLDKMEKLPLNQILPSHGGIIHDTGGAFKKMRDVLLNRNEEIMSELRSQPKRLSELALKLFSGNSRFFPGVAITKSHLLWLEAEGRVKSDKSEKYFMV